RMIQRACSAVVRPSLSAWCSSSVCCSVLSQRLIRRSNCVGLGGDRRGVARRRLRDLVSMCAPLLSCAQHCQTPQGACHSQRAAWCPVLTGRPFGATRWRMTQRGLVGNEDDLRAAFEHLARACEHLGRVAAGAPSIEGVLLRVEEAARLVGEKPEFLKRNGHRLSYAQWNGPRKLRFRRDRIEAFLRGEIPQFLDEGRKG